ncbi:MAG: hypothetical protein WD512_09755, partial [Candidatus Paceibacterota bacterium]
MKQFLLAESINSYNFLCMRNVLPTVKIKVNILPKFPPKIVPVIVPKIVSNALSDVVPSMPTILSLQEKEHKLFSLVSDA